MMRNMEQEKKDSRAVVEVIIEAQKRGWAFITLDNFKAQTGLSAERVKEILRFLSSANLFEYEYLPFEEDGKEDIFKKDLAGRLNEEGAISLLLMKPIKDENILETFLASDEVFNNALKETKYRIELSYDKLRRSLSFKGKEVGIERSHNQRMLCEVIFSQPFGTQFTEDDFSFDDLPRGQDEKRRTINVVNQVNLKIESLTGIHQFIQFKGDIISTR